MNDRYSVHQAAAAANVSRLQLDQWVSRGYIVPSHAPEPGKAREYSLGDIVEIATLAELVRLGIGPGTAAPWVRHLHGFKDDQAVLVVWQGPIELIPSTRPGEPPLQVLRTPGGWTRNNPGVSTFYDPDRPPYDSDIVRGRELPEMLRDPDKRSLVAVNLDFVEQRVRAELTAGGTTGQSPRKTSQSAECASAAKE
jgi:hypothetical protein